MLDYKQLKSTDLRLLLRDRNLRATQSREGMIDDLLAADAAHPEDVSPADNMNQYKDSLQHYVHEMIEIVMNMAKVEVARRQDDVLDTDGQRVMERKRPARMEEDERVLKEVKSLAKKMLVCPALALVSI